MKKRKNSILYLNAEIAEEILKSIGFATERAVDGIACIHMMQEADEEYYDIILMDIQMPNMNGYDATRTIRSLKDSEKANIPILAMTANAFEEDKREVYRCGMNGHLAKPLDMKILAATLEKWMRQ